jgi:MFS family permease
VSPVRRARGAITAVFLLTGVLYGTWAARIPAVRDRLDLSDGELGLALAFIPIGAVVAMPLAGAVSARIGSRGATRLGFAALCLTTATVALAPSLVPLCALAAALGAGMGGVDVAMNVHGVTVERRYERPIFVGLHAGFSFGGLLGAALGALIAGAGVDERVHLALAGGLAAAVGLVWSHRLLPAAEDASAEDQPVFVRPPRRVWALGALAFACLLIEGASADWSGVYLKDELGTGAGLAALGFTAFSVTMTLGRLIGDRLVERAGPVLVVRVGGLIAAVGFGLALLAQTPAAALAGFACLGAGMSSIVPIVFRAAGHVPGVPSGVALSAVTTVGYLGFVTGPAIIGALAELTGLPAALGVVAVLGATVSALAGTTAAVRAEPAAPARTEPMAA